MNVLVTGGAGFVGSHVVEALAKRGDNVCVVDDMSTGLRENVDPLIKEYNVKFVEGDCGDRPLLANLLRDQDAIFHMAAHSEVGFADGSEVFAKNVRTTASLLEELAKSSAKVITFPSSSTVYGAASKIPTPEDYGPLIPISHYGASKLCCEALISAYCHLHGKRGVILRLANVVGARATHGVVLDFIRKLKSNPNSLEILGDGKQSKSYIHVDDCVDAMLGLQAKHDSGVSVYNLGTSDRLDVLHIAKIVVKTMGIDQPVFSFRTGGEGGQGWPGDVTKMQLDIRKITRTGWRPRGKSDYAITKATREILYGDQSGIAGKRTPRPELSS